MALAESEALQRAFLDAPFEEDGWLRALRLLAQATRSSRAQLVGIGDRSAIFNMMTDIDPDYQREFMAIEAWRPDVNWRVAANGGTLEIVSEQHYQRARAHLRSDVYDEHCRAWGGTHGAPDRPDAGQG